MDQIQGQSRAIGMLQAALASERFHHAWLFAGQSGVGKCLTAKAMAKILLCHDAVTDLTGNRVACDQCTSCQLIQREEAIHPDLHIVTKELAAHSTIREMRSRKQMTIPVGLLREFIIGGETSDGKFHDSIAAKSPSMGHGKVFIIDEAHLMAAVGQNSLLKTLEEPPPQTWFILITSSLNKLLPTIQSRCQVVSFASLPDEIIEQWLDAQDPAAEGFVGELPGGAAGGTGGTGGVSGVSGGGEHERAWFVRFCDGSLGRAHLAVTYGLVQWARDILPRINDLVAGRPAACLGEDIAEKIDAMAKRWVDEHRGSSKEAANKMAAQLMWHLIAQHARTKIRSLAQGANPADPMTAEAALYPWLGVIDCLTEAQQVLGSNVNLGLVADHLVTQISSCQRSVVSCQ